MTHAPRASRSCLLVALLAALPAAAAAQSRDLGACAMVEQALNPTDPLHPLAANVDAARAAVAGCGAPNTPTHQLSLALLESVTGRHEAVLAAVTPVLAADAGNRHALRFRCHALANLGRAAEALRDCDKALAAAPEWAAGHHSRGWALSRLGRRADAIAALQRATTLQPRYAFSWNNLAAFQADDGQQAKALDGYQRARALLPGDSLIWRNVGVALTRLRQYDRAAATFDSVIAAHPGYATAWFERGDLEQQRDRPTAARSFVERALTLQPRYAAALVLRGELRLIDQDADGALADYRAAVAADPKWSMPHYRLARTLRQLKRCAEARPPLIEALVLAPEWQALSQEITACDADLRAIRGVIEAALARQPSRMLAGMRATLPDSLHPPARKLDDWSTVLAGVADSASPLGLQALRGRAQALLVLRRISEAMTAFELADRFLARSTHVDWPVSQYRVEVPAALALLHAQHGDQAKALRYLAVVEAAEATFRAKADSASIAQFDRPVLRQPGEGSLAYSMRTLDAPEDGPIEVGLALLRRGEMRGIDWLLRTKPTAASLAALGDLVRAGRVSASALRTRITEAAGRPGDGRQRRPDDWDTYRDRRDDGRLEPIPYYPDARQSLAADRRRVGGLYLKEVWQVLGRQDRSLRLAALDHERDLPLRSAPNAKDNTWSQWLEDRTLGALLVEDLGLAAGAHVLCTTSGVQAYRLTVSPERDGVRFEYRNRGNDWSGGAQNLWYDPRTRRFSARTGNITGEYGDDFVLEGDLTRGGRLRGTQLTLVRCR